MWVGSSNNYAYLVSDAASKKSVIIDPAHPSEVTPLLKSSLKSGSISSLEAIVNTHHHWDHAGGNSEILKQFPQTKRVIAGKNCDGVTETPADKSTFEIGSITVTALHTPCHTQDSICYFFEDKGSPEQKDGVNSPGIAVSQAVFTGDTLFIGGCGKFFEGTPEEMNTALNHVLAELPDSTILYPGHEYTKSNVKFLVKADPQNEKVQWLKKFADDNNETTGKTTMGQEKDWNVFMRVQEDSMKKLTGEEQPSRVMGRLREMKNDM